jgi:hypothetical protein
MNKDKLIEIRDYLIANPDKFEYSYGLASPIVVNRETTTIEGDYFHYDPDPKDFNSVRIDGVYKNDNFYRECYDTPVCGTIGCVAGTVFLLNCSPNEHPKHWGWVKRKAEIILDLSPYEANFLFELNAGFGFESKNLDHGTLQDAIDRLNCLINLA